MNEEPYWHLVPQWLAGRFLGSRRTDRQFLEDVLCGQFCAFLGIKIHDDLFDGHIQDRSLIFAADHLFLAAREALSSHFSGNLSFWNFFDSSLRRTFNAIAAVDQAQLHGYSSAASVTRLAREGYAVCNIATFAVCCRIKRLRVFQRISRCTDELAFVGQLLDDLEDIHVDLQRGRLNYAACFLLGQSNRSRRNIVQQIAWGVVVLGSAERFFNMLRRHLRRAGTLAESTGIPELAKYVRGYREALDSSEDLLHRKRVDLVFEAMTRRKND